MGIVMHKLKTASSLPDMRKTKAKSARKLHRRRRRRPQPPHKKSENSSPVSRSICTKRHHETRARKMHRAAPAILIMTAAPQGRGSFRAESPPYDSLGLREPCERRP